jgi:hypothetical protein
MAWRYMPRPRCTLGKWPQYTLTRLLVEPQTRHWHEREDNDLVSNGNRSEKFRPVPLYVICLLGFEVLTAVTEEHGLLRWERDCHLGEETDRSKRYVFLRNIELSPNYTALPSTTLSTLHRLPYLRSWVRINTLILRPQMNPPHESETVDEFGKMKMCRVYISQCRSDHKLTGNRLCSRQAFVMTSQRLRLGPRTLVAALTVLWCVWFFHHLIIILFNPTL